MHARGTRRPNVGLTLASPSLPQRSSSATHFSVRIHGVNLHIALVFQILIAFQIECSQHTGFHIHNVNAYPSNVDTIRYASCELKSRYGAPFIQCICGALRCRGLDRGSEVVCSQENSGLGITSSSDDGDLVVPYLILQYAIQA